MSKHICKICNKDFKTKRLKATFCSNDCYHKSMKNVVRIDLRKRIMKKCLVCEKEFETRFCHSRVKTCSKKCGGIIRRGSFPERLKEKIEKKCSNCSKLFKTLPSNKNIFCSRKCFLNLKSLNVKYPQKQRLQGSAWIKKRKIVIERDKVCTVCKNNGDQIHHIIPYSISGDDSLENLTLLCRSCHLKIHLEMWNDDKKLSI